MQWIEQAEARQVLAAAHFERAPTPPWSSMAAEMAGQILPGLRSWIAARHPMGGAVPQVQAIGIEPAIRLVVANHRRGGDEGYSPTW
jgi:hypothetical protein